MSTSVVPDDPTLRRKFNFVQVIDPKELDTGDPLRSRLAAGYHDHTYRLLDRSIIGQRFTAPISNMSQRRFGTMAAGHIQNRFATKIDIDGEDMDRYCFAWTVRGRMTLTQNGVETTASDATGLIYPGLPGARIVTGDDNERQNVWIEGAALRRGLEQMLGDQVRHAVTFAPGVPLDHGPGATLFSQLRFIHAELKRPDGIADNKVAVASYSDLILQIVLGSLRHSYSDRLQALHSAAVPGHLRRAEDFMRANAAAPIQMEDVALAAGCAVRTLFEAFRRFRGTTPLAMLHRLRLERVRDELRGVGGGAATADIARRYGFTNAARFNAAYVTRFGEHPSETRRKGAD